MLRVVSVVAFASLLALSSACEFLDSSVCSACASDPSSCAATIIAYCDSNDDSACDQVGVSCPFAASASLGTKSPCEVDICIGDSSTAEGCEQHIYDYCASQVALEEATAGSVNDTVTADPACAGVTDPSPPAGISGRLVLEAEDHGVFNDPSEWLEGSSMAHSGTSYFNTLTGSMYIDYTVPVSGYYNVFVAWVPHRSRDTNVPVTVTHVFGSDTTYYDQTSGGSFFSTGIYFFTQGFTMRVEIAASGTTGYVNIDAFAIQKYVPSSVYFADNDGALSSSTGSWTPNSKAPHIGADYAYSNTHGDTFSWTVPVSNDGTHFVSAFLPVGSNRDTSVPYDITHDGGVDTFYLDHTALQGWNFLAALDFTGQVAVTMRVDQQDGSTGFVMADAIRVAELQPTISMDCDFATTQGIEIVGDWATKSLSVPDGYMGSNYRYAKADGAYITFTPTILETGYYEVYAWAAAHTNRDPKAKHVVVDATGYPTFVEMDQRINHNTPASLGIFQLSDGDLNSVTVHSSSSYFVTADGMIFKHRGVPNTYIFDIEDYFTTSSVVQVTGSWVWSKSAPNYQTAYYYTVTAGNTVTFTPNLGALAAESGEYRLYASHSAGSNRPSDALYTITLGSNTYTATVDQRTNGATWIALGTFTIDTTQPVSVRLTASASGVTIVDAIKFQALSDF